MKLGSYIVSGQATGNKLFNDKYSSHLVFNNSSVEKRIKTAIVILKNPSSSFKAHIFYGINLMNSEDVDSTTNNVLDKINTLKYKDIYILNLLPYFSPYPRDLNLIYESQNTPNSIDKSLQSFINNIKEIRNVLSNNNNSNTDLIFAWGNNRTSSFKHSLFIDAINSVQAILNSFSNLNMSLNVYDKTRSNIIGIPLVSITTVSALHGKLW